MQGNSTVTAMSGKESQVFSGSSNEDVRLGDLGYEQGVTPLFSECGGMLIMQSSSVHLVCWAWSGSASVS